MKNSPVSRRAFLQTTGLTAGALVLGGANSRSASRIPNGQGGSGSADTTLHIKNSAVEIAPERIVSATTYNGKFPGPLLRF